MQLCRHMVPLEGWWYWFVGLIQRSLQTLILIYFFFCRKKTRPPNKVAPVNEVRKVSSASGAGCCCCCSCSNRGGGLGLSEELLTSEAVETEGAVA